MLRLYFENVVDFKEAVVLIWKTAVCLSDVDAAGVQGEKRKRDAEDEGDDDDDDE